MKQNLILAVAWMLFVGLQATAATEYLPEQVRIGVLAKRGKEQCLAQWGATATYLTEQIPGHAFSIIPLGFDEIQPAINHRNIEFVFANPSFYVNLEKRLGARRIATLCNLHSDGTKHRVLAGTLFCRADREEIQNLGDLKNKRFMAVDERSLGGWHAGWRKLKAQGIDPHRDLAALQFGGTHDAVVYAVRSGAVDAGTVRSDTLERMAGEGKIRLGEFKVLHPHTSCEEQYYPQKINFVHSTLHYPEWPFSKLPHTPDNLAKKVSVALMQMLASNPAAIDAKCAGWSIPQNYQPVHECLMELRLPPYEEHGEIVLSDVLRKYWKELLGLCAMILLVLLLSIRTSRLKTQLRHSVLLQKEREKLVAILEAMESGVYMVDEAYNIKYANATIRKEFGPTDGLKCYEYLHGFDEPCSFCKNDAVFAGETVHWEWTSPKNGRTYALIDSPIKNRDGDIFKLETFTDITEERLAGAENTRLMAAIEQAAETVVITDAEGTIQYVNPAFEKITGYTRDEAIGQNPRILKSGAQNPEFYEKMWDTLKRGKPWSGQFINKKKDGTPYTEEATLSPVKDSSGATINYVAVKRDITHELALEEQYLHAQKMDSVGRLAGGIAHDFNNILQTITGFCEIILGELKSQSPHRPDVVEIQKAAKHAGDLTRQLLSFSRKQPTEYKVVDLNTVLSNGKKMLQQALDESFRLTLEMDAQLKPVNVDASQILQIVLNLVGNARDAMPDGGTIALCTQNRRITAKDLPVISNSKLGEWVCIQVTDSGSGMNESQLKHLFEPFYTTKQQGKGTGLGLSVVYGIVQRHGGWIHLESTLGKGSVFEVFLPAYDARTPPNGSEEDSSNHALLGKRILLVEDDSMIRELTAEILQDVGYAVSAAADVAEAEQLFAGHHGEFDMLFSDVVLPDGNGTELAGFCQERHPGLPVLLFSGYPDERARVDRIQENGFSYIRKPFNLKTLLDTVERTISGIQA